MASITKWPVHYIGFRLPSFRPVFFDWSLRMTFLVYAIALGSCIQLATATYGYSKISYTIGGRGDKTDYVNVAETVSPFWEDEWKQHFSYAACITVLVQRESRNRPRYIFFSIQRHITQAYGKQIHNGTQSKIFTRSILLNIVVQSKSW